MARTRWPSDLEPRPLAQARQIRPAAPVGAKKTWGPADRSFLRTARTASADSEVRPGPRPRPYAHTTAKPLRQGREAQPTSSLPTRRAAICVRPRLRLAAYQPVMASWGAA